jgi:hypothetical protein
LEPVPIEQRALLRKHAGGEFLEIDQTGGRKRIAGRIRRTPVSLESISERCSHMTSAVRQNVSG